jgi:tripartite-type tricarboxylate transporter receptor subunit TctC
MGRRVLLAAFTTALFLSAALPVVAAEFPSKPVSLIVPRAPGGSSHVCLRVLADTTGKYLGQPIMVENKRGGGGTVRGTTMAATAMPDGYTVTQIPISVIRYPYMT